MVAQKFFRAGGDLSPSQKSATVDTDASRTDFLTLRCPSGFVLSAARHGKVTIALQPHPGYIVTQVFWYPSFEILGLGIQYAGVKMSNLRQTPLEQFKLPGKLIRILHRNNIQTFGEIEDAVNQGHLLCLRQVGKKIAAELTQLVAQPDLYLATANENNVDPGENTPQAQSKSEFLMKLDQVHVEKLELHPKITHALTRAGIGTIGDLLRIQPSRLREINRIGPKASREIQVALDHVMNSPQDYIE